MNTVKKGKKKQKKDMKLEKEEENKLIKRYVIKEKGENE